jgi:hypothetical protein
MEVSTIVSFLLNGLMAIALYFMKQSNDNTKADIDRIRDDVKDVRDTAYKKEDFKEFKEELWRRFDKLEADVKQVRHG